MKKKNYKYILNTSYLDALDQCNVYIKNFLFSLRNDQELMFKIIQKSTINYAEKWGKKKKHLK